MSTNFQPFIDFHSWADEHQVIGTDCLGVGTDGLGNGAKYIPFDALEEYWQDHRISHILNTCSDETPIHVSIDDILTRYLRIFSILVYISTTESVKLNYITRFIERDIDDKLLPFKIQPDLFPNSPDGTQTFEQFQKAQWLFSSVVLGPYRLRSKELPTGSVLPFTVQEVLAGRNGESTIVKKCVVHPSCGLSARSIVLKEFDSSEIELSFKNEVDSYITLANNISPDMYSDHFLEFYGSFKKGKKAFIMLEYTDQGTLFSFFNRNELPLERHEFHDLWSSLSNLFIGLDHIHNLDHGSKNTSSGAIRCVHQDLKPTNIFVFKRGDSNSYQYHFKIGDFGMSSLALVKTRNKSIRGQDNASTKMYGAPEQTKRYAAQDDIDYGALWEMDIWSMGCVLFEILVWMTCGSRGVSAFFRMRQQETDTDRRHRTQGYSGCFHNGTERIQAVDDMMKLVLERRRVFDDLSGPIGDLILNEMLIPSNKRRLEARTLLPRFEKILEAEKRPPDHPATIGLRSLITTAQEGGPLYGGTTEEDRGDNGPHETEQARMHASPRETRDFEHQRLSPTGPRASNSLTGSRHGGRGWNESRSSSGAFPVQEGSTSATPIQPYERAQTLQSSPLTDSPHPISRMPVNSRLDKRISNLALEDPEKEPAHTSAYDHRRTWTAPTSDYQTDDGDVSRRLRNEESGSKVKPYALVTVSEVLNWIEKKKNGWMVEPLRDHERAMREIKDREQIFVVDDSDTMRDQHWDRVVELVSALGYLVKSADPDGVELFFTSRPTEPKKSGGKEITSLVRSLKEHRRTSHVGVCNMENHLGPILDHVKAGLKSSKRPKFLQRNRRGTNVYILTDAIWEGGTEVRCGVEEPIKSLRRTMKELGKTRATVALQFIQLGDNAVGEARLRYLDDTLGKELNFDIVDYRHHQRDGVWHMLVGSISRDLDKDNNVGSHAAVT